MAESKAAIGSNTVLVGRLNSVATNVDIANTAILLGFHNGLATNGTGEMLDARWSRWNYRFTQDDADRIGAPADLQKMMVEVGMMTIMPENYWQAFLGTSSASNQLVAAS